MSTSTERSRRKRAKAKAAKATTDPIRGFLSAVLAVTSTDAATLAAQDTASDILERLETTDTSSLRRLAVALGAKVAAGRAVYTPTETRRQEALRLLAARVKDGSATAGEIRTGLRLAARAVRAGPGPVDDREVQLAIGRMLLGEGRPAPADALGIEDEDTSYE